MKHLLNTVIVRHLGQEPYLTSWRAMQQFTNQRNDQTHDEIWILEHPAVFTQGQNGKPEHIIAPGDIPIIASDRGGQVTYHGPGQLVAYTMIDLKRKQLNVREMVSILENAVIGLLDELSIHARADCKAPGVYIGQKKICSVGLRVRKGATFHGLALNVNMDLEPFSRINPCGFAQLKMTQLSEIDQHIDPTWVNIKLVEHLLANLGYNNPQFYSEPWHGTENYAK